MQNEFGSIISKVNTPFHIMWDMCLQKFGPDNFYQHFLKTYLASVINLRVAVEHAVDE